MPGLVGHGSCGERSRTISRAVKRWKINGASAAGASNFGLSHMLLLPSHRYRVRWLWWRREFRGEIASPGGIKGELRIQFRVRRPLVRPVGLESRAELRFGHAHPDGPVGELRGGI